MSIKHRRRQKSSSPKSTKSVNESYTSTAPSTTTPRRRASLSDPSAAARHFISPFNFRNVLARYLYLFRSALLGLYTTLHHILGMALGLGRLWTKSDAASKDADELRLQSINGDAGGGMVKRRRKAEYEKPTHYPGMVNLSGTLCYMNSVLQALSSVPSLVAHLDRIYALAEQVDEPSMVSDSLAEVLRALNTPHLRPPSAIRPNDLLLALYELPATRRLLGTREQQDAHELFLVLAEAVSNESVKVAKIVARSKGLGEVVSMERYAAGSMAGRLNSGKGKQKGESERVRGLAQPWEGLMARRKTCGVCGWSDGVRMDSLGGMELSLPQYGDVSLESCIAQYLAPENISDVTCEMCSLKRTRIHYAAEVERLSLPATSKPSKMPAGTFGALDGLTDVEVNGGPSEMSSARKRRAKEAKRVETRLREMVDSGTVTGFGEAYLPPTNSSTASAPVKWQTSRTPCVREALITRAPQTLRLHLIRSEYTPYGQLLKKTARVAFPLFLDLTPFVSRGIWDQQQGIMGELADGRNSQNKVIYRLASVILHYGYTHSSGHYVCIRRGPVPPPSPKEDDQEPFAHVPSTINKACPDGCTCEDCVYFGQARDLDAVPGRGWLRISDADVEEVGVEELVASRAQVSMLFYEKVGEYAGPKSVDERVREKVERPLTPARQVDEYGGRHSPEQHDVE